MTLGVVVVTFECREYVLECLESLDKRIAGALERTVIVDNASTDGTLAAIEARFPEVWRIAEPRNMGFATAVNDGLRALQDCDVICILNPDTIVLDDGFLAAADYLREHEGLGAAGARIENPDGSLQASCRAFPGYLTALFNRHSLATKLLPGNRFSRAYLMTDWSHTEVREVDWVSGACMLVHRRAIEAVGLFDTAYFFSIEDVDYCKRMREAGLKTVYYPMARVEHSIGGSSRHAVYRAMAAHHRGMWHYYRTHMDGNVALDAVTAAGILGRLGLHAASYSMRRVVERLRGEPAG